LNTKLTQGRTLGLIGYEGKPRQIKHTICWRKPADIRATRRVMKKYKQAIGVVSAHNLYRKPNTPFCNIWCHCFGDVEKYLPGKPAILLSESDFIDPLSIDILDRPQKWDFCYFTIGGMLGNTYKGMHVFVDSLPVLCGQLGLKGVLVKYAKVKQNFVLNKTRQRIWREYKSHIRILKGKRSSANIMSQSQFVFFPNEQDCSPLLLAEALVRGKPVLVNDRILGGWKYVNDDTGSLFNLANIRDRAEFVLNRTFDTQRHYMMKYGYKNSSIKLAEFCNKHLSGFQKYSMVGFAGSECIMNMVGKSDRSTDG